MQETKVHFKLYKSGKKWLVTAISVVTFATGMLQVTQAKADATESGATSGSDSQSEQVSSDTKQSDTTAKSVALTAKSQTDTSTTKVTNSTTNSAVRESSSSSSQSSQTSSSTVNESQKESTLGISSNSSSNLSSNSGSAVSSDIKSGLTENQLNASSANKDSGSTNTNSASTQSVSLGTADEKTDDSSLSSNESQESSHQNTDGNKLKAESDVQSDNLQTGQVSAVTETTNENVTGDSALLSSQLTQSEPLVQDSTIMPVLEDESETLIDPDSDENVAPIVTRDDMYTTPTDKANVNLYVTAASNGKVYKSQISVNPFDSTNRYSQSFINSNVNKLTVVETLRNPTDEVQSGNYSYKLSFPNKNLNKSEGILVIDSEDFNYDSFVKSIPTGWTVTFQDMSGATYTPVNQPSGTINELTKTESGISTVVLPTAINWANMGYMTLSSNSIGVNQASTDYVWQLEIPVVYSTSLSDKETFLLDGQYLDLYKEDPIEVNIPLLDSNNGNAVVKTLTVKGMQGQDFDVTPYVPVGYTVAAANSVVTIGTTQSVELSGIENEFVINYEESNYTIVGSTTVTTTTNTDVTKVVEKFVPNGYKLSDMAVMPVLTNGTGDTIIIPVVEDIRHVEIKYIDDTTGKELRSDTKAGKNTYVINYSTSEYITSYQNEGYQLVSDNFSSSDRVYSNDGEVYEVHLAHKISTSDLKQIKTLTVKYTGPASMSVPADQATTVTFQRTANYDEVTQTTTYTAWNVDGETEATFAPIDSPKITGYTPDVSQVMGKTITGAADDLTVLVTYTGDWQNVYIKYIDETTGKLLSQDKVTGKSGETISYTTTSIIQKYEQGGYNFEQSDFPQDTFTFDNNDEVDQVYVVHFTHHMVKISADNPGKIGQPILSTNPDGQKFTADATLDKLTRTINQKVAYQYVDGQAAASPVHNEVTFTRTGLVDAVNGDVQYGNWETTNNEFKAITSPAIAHYTADIPTILATTVMPDSIDQSVTVTYHPVNESYQINFVDTTSGLETKLVGKIPVVGTINSTLAVQLPAELAGYRFAIGASDQVLLNGETTMPIVVQVAPVKKYNVDFVDPNNQVLGSGTTTGIKNEQVTITLPESLSSNYRILKKNKQAQLFASLMMKLSLSSDDSESVTLNGDNAETIIVNVTPIEKTYRVNFIDEDNQVVGTTTVTGTINQTVTVMLPAELAQRYRYTSETHNQVALTGDDTIVISLKLAAIKTYQVHFVDSDGQTVGRTTVTGITGQRVDVSDEVPTDYQLVGSGVVTMNGDALAAIDVKVIPQVKTYGVQFVDNAGQVIKTINVNGIRGAQVDVSDEVPTDYVLVSTGKLTLNGDNTRVLVVKVTPQVKTYHVQFVNDQHQIVKTSTIAGIKGATVDLSNQLPVNYEFASTGHVTLNGHSEQVITVNVQPIVVKPETQTYTVHFVDETGQTIKVTTIEGNKGTTVSLISQLPANYEFVSNEQVTLNGDPEQVITVNVQAMTIAPETRTYTISFVDQDGQTLKTMTVQGATSQVIDVSTQVPTDYRLVASGVITLPADSTEVLTVLVTAIQSPVEPETPTQPIEPETPVQPAEPETPTQPTKPETPVQPAEPETPTQPTEPETPVQPVEPETPTQPTEPETPVQPVEPETPTQPTEPETPVQSAETETPTQPTKPETPVQPVGSETPAPLVKSAMQDLGTPAVKSMVMKKVARTQNSDTAQANVYGLVRKNERLAKTSTPKTGRTAATQLPQTSERHANGVEVLGLMLLGLMCIVTKRKRRER